MGLWSCSVCVNSTSVMLQVLWSCSVCVNSTSVQLQVAGGF